MTLTKVTYTDTVTRINANNLNDIQDHIIDAENAIDALGTASELNYNIGDSVGTGYKAIDFVGSTPTALLPVSAIADNDGQVLGGGYQKCADGTLLQWGNADFGTISANSSTSQTIYFQYAYYSYTSYIVLADTAYQYHDVLDVVAQNNQSKGQFKLYAKNKTENALTNTKVSWFAIGRWKE